MHVSASRVRLICGTLFIAGGIAPSAAWAQQVVLKDQSFMAPNRESVMVVTTEGRVATGMSVTELTNLVRRVEDQGKALDALRKTNDALSRKVEEQAQKIAKMERSQTSTGRSDDSQKGELDKLTRKVDDQRRRIDDIKSSVDDLRRRVK